MTNVLTILGGRLFNRSRDIARREGTRRPSTPPLRPMPPAPRLQGTSTGGRRTGKVLSHVGLSRSAVYSIQLEDGTIINNVTPRQRGKGAGPEFDIRPAADGTPCEYSIQQVNGQPTVVVHECEEEIDSEACAALPGSGTAGGSATTGAVVTATEQANTPFRPRTKLVISWTIDITNLTTDRYGLLLYTFPVGAIDIQSIVADLVISSSNVTNSLQVGIGTDDASGTTGTGLSGAQEDVVPETNPGLISASLDYERIWPDTGESRPVLYDGTSAAIAIYLNLATTTFAWNATGQVAVTGTIWLNWTNAGQFDS